MLTCHLKIFFRFRIKIFTVCILDTESYVLTRKIFFKKIMKPLPFSNENEILEYCKSFPTPFYLYDEETIKNQCNQLKKAFCWNEGFQNYFAVKATPNPAILEIIKQQGFGVDCSSYVELLLVESVGFRNEEIFFTSNNTIITEYQKAVELGAIINLDDVNHLEMLNENKMIPEHICFRYNPGGLRTGNHIIGQPLDSKFGITKDQLFYGYERAKSLGCTKFSLHTMIVSNCLDVDELFQNSKMMFTMIRDIKDRLNITIHQVNLGGGIGIPYKPCDKGVDIDALGEKIQTLYNEMVNTGDLQPCKISFECGRFLTGPAGILLTRIINKKTTYKNYLGVDTSIANLMRPAMYGSYHHITHIRNDTNRINDSSYRVEEKVKDLTTSINDGIFDVVGSLCENNDKLATDRFIGTEIKVGDILVIHDAGAHCSAMGFNYNGKLRCAEYIRNKNGVLKQIRRPEAYTDLFATLSLL